MELEAELLGMHEDPLAQVDQDRLADARGQHGVPGDEHGTDDSGEQVGRDREAEGHPVLAHQSRQTGIDTVGDQRGTCDLGCGADHHDDDRHCHARPQRAKQNTEQPQRPRADLFTLGLGEVVALLTADAGDTRVAHAFTSRASRSSSSSRLEITNR